MKTTFTFLLLFVLLSVNGQKFKSISMPTAANMVYAVYIDDNGVKWFGTDYGLARYDGSVWKLYNSANNNKFIADTVKDIVYENTEFGDELWLATTSGAVVSVFNTDGLTNATNFYTGKEDVSFVDDNVHAIGIDMSGAKWFVTSKAVDILESGTWSHKTADDFPTDFGLQPGTNYNKIATAGNTAFIASDTKGVGRVVNGSGVDVFSGGSAWFTWGPMFTESDNLQSIYIDSENKQWFGTDAGVVTHTGTDGNENWSDNYYNTTDGLIDNNVTAIIEDNNGNMWFGTKGGVSVLKTNATWESFTTANGLADNYINDIAIDTDGTIWFATNNGISQYDAGSFNNMTTDISKRDLQNKTLRLMENPVSEQARFKLNLSKSGSVNMDIYSLTGQKVKSLAYGYRSAGDYNLTWDLKDQSGSRVSNGIYLINLQAEGIYVTKKIVVID